MGWMAAGIYCYLAEEEWVWWSSFFALELEGRKEGWSWNVLPEVYIKASSLSRALLMSIC